MNGLSRDLLNIVRQETVRSGCMPSSSADDQAIAYLNQRSVEAFGCGLPEEYVTFLQQVNGFMIHSVTLAGAGKQMVQLHDGSPYGNLVIPDAIDRAQEIVIDYAPLFDSTVTLTHGPLLCGWDLKANGWFRGRYDTGRFGVYRSFDELVTDILFEAGVNTRHLMPPSFVFSSLDAQGRRVYGTGLGPA